MNLSNGNLQDDAYIASVIDETRTDSTYEWPFDCSDVDVGSLVAPVRNKLAMLAVGLNKFDTKAVIREALSHVLSCSKPLGDKEIEVPADTAATHVYGKDCSS